MAGGGLVMGASIYGRDLPPTDDLLDDYTDRYDTVENRTLLAREMAALLADAVEMPARYEESLADALDDFLDLKVRAEDRVRLMANTPTVPRGQHVGGIINTIVPPFEQFALDESPEDGA